jgi:endonuclease/exonuclease/phosphatase family metal-dependent hydrolase
VPIKLLTLNIEASRHRDRVHAALVRHQPDVACLQEVLEDDCPFFASAADYRCLYANSALWPDDANPALARNWGLAILTRLPVDDSTILDYSENTRIRTFDEPNSPSRKLLTAQVRSGAHACRIITTHFTWSVEGQISAQQRADFTRLKAAISRYPEFVLCGDFNAPRGGEMFALFESELALTSHLPADVTTTIDAQYHHAGALELAVDTIFTTSAYSVSSIEVLDGLSDHKAILAMLLPQGRVTP